MEVTHAFVSAVPDGDDSSVVRPSSWNAPHAISVGVRLESGDFTVQASDDTIVYTGPGADTGTMPDATSDDTHCVEIKNAGSSFLILDATGLGQFFFSSLQDTIVLQSGGAVKLQAANGAWQVMATSGTVTTANLVETDDLSDADWEKVNVTVANAGLANQAIMEEAVDDPHYVHIVLAKPGVAGNYRLQFDAVGISRTEVWASIADGNNTNFLQAFYDITVPNNFSNGGGGGGMVAGSVNIVELGGGILRVTRNWTHNNTTGIHLYIGISTPTGVDSYPGDITKGMGLTNITVFPQ